MRSKKLTFFFFTMTKESQLVSCLTFEAQNVVLLEKENGRKKKKKGNESLNS